MSRRRKNEDGGSESPAWLITFSDLMTLLLTFFVLLLSMAVIDERAKRVVLGSVARTFGAAKTIPNPVSTKDARQQLYEPGRMEDMNKEDLEPLRDMIFDEYDKDLDFQENRYVQIFSINDEVLFVPGGTELSARGLMLLDRILPYLQNLEYPLLVAGHTAPRRAEEGLSYSSDPDRGADSTWLLSFRRSMAVYRHLTGRGIPPSRLSLEAFGQFHPRYSNETPEGRRKNRRVDIVLDKRNLEWIRKVESIREKDPDVPHELFYRGFRFDLAMPGASREEQQ